jgi:oligosaccharide repeat unit polymerase
VIEVLIVVTVLGVLLSSRQAVDLGNPFQIYFSIWLLIILLYWTSAETFIPVSTEFFVLILFDKLYAISLLLIFKLQLRSLGVIRPHVIINKFRNQGVFFAQIIVTIFLPLVFVRASELAGGESIFVVSGYTNLRYALTEGGESYGFLAYFLPLSFVVGSLNVFAYKQNLAGLWRLIFSLVVALFYVYLNTGRTSLLLFLCLMIIPLVVVGVIKIRGVIFSILFFVIVFVFFAVMLTKGVEVGADFLSNINSFLENIRGYTVAPFLAFSELIETDFSLGWGENTFRFFISLIYASGLSDVKPVDLIKDYAFVPDPTNVYTVYEVYFRDFSYFGMLMPMLFLSLHAFMYRRARFIGGIWIFFYAASVYPLMMQFFQDQYFSLLSMWLQLGFWYWLFLASKMEVLLRNEVCHD